jgi:DNA-binding LacI/PurR family transcriptional regulator
LADAGSLPTAVFCTSDDVALGFIEAARAAGVSCPEDISVIGFGNESVRGAGALHELTTIDFSRELDVAQTLRMLEEQISGQRTTPERRRVPVHLVVRSSTGPARTHDVRPLAPSAQPATAQS